MLPIRRKKIGSLVIEEFHWCGEAIVYVNNYLDERTFEEVCAEAENHKDRP